MHNGLRTYEVRYLDEVDNTIGSKVIIIKAYSIEDALNEARYRASKRVAYSVASIQLVGSFK